MSRKKKEKKKNTKKEKYAKFKRDKPSALNITSPDLSPEQQKQKQDDELRINTYLRYSKNRPSLSLRERRKKGKN